MNLLKAITNLFGDSKPSGVRDSYGSNTKYRPRTPGKGQTGMRINPRVRLDTRQIEDRRGYGFDGGQDPLRRLAMKFALMQALQQPKTRRG